MKLLELCTDACGAAGDAAGAAIMSLRKTGGRS